MRLLAIDTSGRACSIALFDHDTLIAERHEEIGRGHAESLIPWIAEFPDGGRANQILVGCGPGSFTGVRVGVAAARALALGWQCKVAGMPSPALVAASVEVGAAPFLVAIEGGHGELFVQPFNTPGAAGDGPTESLRPEAAAVRFTQSLIVGSGAARLVEARGYGDALLMEANAAKAMLLEEDLRSFPPTPIYGRGADAKPMAIAAS